MNGEANLSSLPVILASGSHSRRTMLAATGLSFEIKPADIDEYSIQDEMVEAGSALLDVPERLAVEKARVIAAQHGDALVIGSDQILVCDDEIFTKSKSETGAREKLLRLSGKTHYLMTGTALLKGDQVLWSYKSSSAMKMHALDDALLDYYMAHAGEGLLRTVGAYEIEGVGAWLFEDMQGDSYSIMGMQLLPLLSALRQHGGFLAHV